MRIGNVEFRCYDNGRYELVEWFADESSGPYCYSIAFFIKGGEDYYMKTVGSRFFDAGDDAFFVGRHAMFFLNAMFERAENERKA